MTTVNMPAVVASGLHLYAEEWVLLNVVGPHVAPVAKKNCLVSESTSSMRNCLHILITP